nr:MAG TPA: hypothetical protein [Caudoviricetes sp.]
MKRKPEPSQFPKQEFQPAPRQISPAPNQQSHSPQKWTSCFPPLDSPGAPAYNGRKWPLREARTRPK